MNTDMVDLDFAPIPPLSTVVRSIERAYLCGLLTLTGGKVSQAAAIAGRNRTEFYRVLKRHGLQAKHYRVQASA